MKLVELKCKNCGSNLKADENAKEVKCKYCDTTFKIDDEVQHIKYDDMEQAGYEFEKGKIRAQEEHKNEVYKNVYNQEKKKKKNNWLIILWIFFFPFMITYYIIKSEKLTKKQKIIITIILWTIFFIIGITNDDSEDKQNLKEKIIECYSEETYNKLDEIYGVENITSNNYSQIACDNLILRYDYKTIEISLDDEKQLLQIKENKKIIYEKNKETDKIDNKNTTITEDDTKKVDEADSKYIEADKYVDYLNNKISNIVKKQETIFKNFKSGTLDGGTYQLYLYADSYYNYNDFKQNSISITREIIASISEKKYKKVDLYPKSILIQIKYCGYGKDLNSGNIENRLFPLGVFDISSNELSKNISYEDKININEIWF